MRDFLVDLLPADTRAKVHERGRGRRTLLLVALLALSLVGVAIHSWDQARRARAVRDAMAGAGATGGDLEQSLRTLMAERTTLTESLTTYRSLALPLELSDLVATVSGLLPKQASLVDMQMRLVTREPVAKAAAPTTPGATAPPAPPRRTLEVRFRGLAAGNAEIGSFERALAGTPPFDKVAQAENRSVETPDGRLQEFVITAEVNLDRPFKRQASAPVAMGGDR
ncbi:MAG: hypothetical protein U0574_01725 [Phycisphaerales bacterium]